MLRQQLINSIIEAISIPNPNYLEIGVLYGGTFNNVHTLNKDGVDTEYFAPCPSVNFKMNSDTFFEKHCTKQYDIIFIDGLHTAFQVTKDLVNSINAINKERGGYIIIGAIYPHGEAEQRAYMINSIGPNAGDVWKAVYNIMDQMDEICDKIIFVPEIEAGALIFKIKPGNTQNITIDPTIPTMNIIGTYEGPEKVWTKYSYQDNFIPYMKRIYRYFPDRNLKMVEWF